jgi:hypothetical protein
LPRGIDPDQVLEGMQTLKRLADEAERDIPVSVFAPPPREEVLRRFQDAGVQRVILMLPAEEESKTLSRLDRLARFVH